MPHESARLDNAQEQLHRGAQDNGDVRLADGRSRGYATDYLIAMIDNGGDVFEQLGEQPDAQLIDAAVEALQHGAERHYQEIMQEVQELQDVLQRWANLETFLMLVGNAEALQLGPRDHELAAARDQMAKRERHAQDIRRLGEDSEALKELVCQRMKEVFVNKFLDEIGRYMPFAVLVAVVAIALISCSQML
ncbi:hypothetical protein SLS62_002137 [Diatrype stigma]|uniref:Uncharacterized protein n=1 Tax=Diatrype stigma TaxID=117547 RepID=A0AAN9UYD6_9PEZI